jgi:hypothetical protein
MLLQILVHLRCARAAAHTSSLSRRWRGLWRHLFELSFRDMPLDAVDAALQQVACPALSRLEIEIPERHRILDLLASPPSSMPPRGSPRLISS